MYLIAKNHFQGGNTSSGENLAKHLGVPTGALKPVLMALEQRGLLFRTGDEIPIYVPARAPETIPIKEILDIIRMAEENCYFNVTDLPSENKVEQLKVEQLIDDINLAIEQVLKERSLRSLLLDEIDPKLNG